MTAGGKRSGAGRPKEAHDRGGDAAKELHSLRRRNSPLTWKTSRWRSNRASNGLTGPGETLRTKPTDRS